MTPFPVGPPELGGIEGFPVLLLLFGPLGHDGGPPFVPGPMILAELFPLLFPVLVPPLVDDPSELKSSVSSRPFVPLVAFGSY